MAHSVIDCPNTVAALALAVGEDIHRVSPRYFGGATDLTRIRDMRTEELACLEAAEIWRSMHLDTFQRLAALCERTKRIYESTKLDDAHRAFEDGIALFKNWFDSQPNTYLENLMQGIKTCTEDFPAILSVIARFSRGET